MSLATLKRKTEANYNNISVGQKNFSLNGTHRSQGYIGQTSLSRSLPRSLMNGNTLRGHGGCCGEYKINPNILSAVKTTEDISIIKSSVKNNSGMIHTKYRWINRASPFSTVKPDINIHLNTQGQYAESISTKTINCIDLSLNNNVIKSFASKCTNPSAIAIMRKFNNYNSYYTKNKCTFSKPESDYLPITYQEYSKNINNNCNSNDVFNIQKNYGGTPLP